MSDQPRQECLSQRAKLACPGVDFALFGYNSLKGNPLRSGRDPGFTYPIFDASHVTTDCQNSASRGIVVLPDVSCVTSFKSEVVRTPYELTRLLAVTSRLDPGGDGWGALFAANEDFQKLSLELEQSVLVVSTATCSLYQVTHLQRRPPFHPMFLEWILRLNSTHDKDVYLEFVNTYGTHFVSRARLGASITLVHKMDNNVYWRQTEGHVTAAADYSAAALLGLSSTLTSAQQHAADESQPVNLTVTSARDCYKSCFEDNSCMAFTLHDNPVSGFTCTRYADSLLSLKQEMGINFYFFSSPLKSIVKSGQPVSLGDSTTTSDWYKVSCVTDAECPVENAMCFVDRCLCLPGFFFSTRDHTCSATRDNPCVQNLCPSLPVVIALFYCVLMNCYRQKQGEMCAHLDHDVNV
ncbi:hypothetical protein C0Q70_12053 [Pomacea canaliculata]|uniref:MACPF domain-containing protein n=1 Tax=Pomacea canaliculata TaxID=400727 RepID=A0A2T7P0G7_POMCA|nr:hypothetical protein C0Q70_12053 [Pomacea canaliculata]